MKLQHATQKLLGVIQNITLYGHKLTSSLPEIVLIVFYFVPAFQRAQERHSIPKTLQDMSHCI